MPGRKKGRSRQQPGRPKDLIETRRLVRDITDRLLNRDLEPLASAVEDIETADDAFLRGALFALTEACKRHDERIAHLICGRCGIHARTFRVYYRRGETIRACERCGTDLQKDGWKPVVHIGYGP